MGRISHSTCAPDRFTGIIHTRTIAPHTLDSSIYYYFFLPSLTIVYSVHLSAGHTQHWYSVIVQHTGASDTDSHAVCPSSITPWTMSCASRRRVHQKTQRSYGRLTRTRQAYNLYWLSWRIWKMSSWTHSIPRSAFPSWKLIIWLPPAYCCGCAWKPEAAVFTCNNCLSLHRYITLLLHLWWCISLASYQLKMNLTIIIKKYCIVHFMFSQRADSSYGSTFKFTREQNFECFPASMTANVIILTLFYFQKHTFLAISPLWCPSKHGRCSRGSAFRRAEWFSRRFYRLNMHCLESGMKPNKSKK